MRGQPVSRETRKADLVLVAARYAPADSRLYVAQAYRRRGPIWSDLLLLDRPSLIQALEEKRHVYAGRLTGLAHEFEMLHPIRLEKRNGDVVLRADDMPAVPAGDALGVPLF